MSSHIFASLGAKKHSKYRCFLHLGNPKPWYLRCFLPRVAKTTVFTVVVPVPSKKHWYLRSFNTTRTKTMYFTMFLLPERSKKS